MSVLQSDLRFYGSANMQDITGTTGGAVTFTTKVFFQDLTANVVPSVVSSASGDTAATLNIYSLSASGVIQNETITLVGTTVTAATLTAQRLMKGIAGGTTAVGDIAILGNKIISNHTMQAGSTSTTAVLASGDGSAANVAIGSIIRILNNSPAGVNFQLRTIIGISTDTVTVSRAWGVTPTVATTYDIWTGMQFDLAPNQITTCRRIFYGSYAQAAGGTTNTWYEKIFAVNDNTTTALTTASILKQIDPVNLYSGSGALNFSLCNALNDSSTITTNLNPGTPPASNTAYSSGTAPQTVAVPSPQNLPSGTAPNTGGAEGIWLQLVLVAGEATVNSFVDMRITGQTI
jgi:hypothetical protein